MNNRKEECMQKRCNIVPDEMRLPLVLAVACNTVTYFGSRLLMAGRVHYDISGRLDALIPLVPWTVAVYFGSYVFWVVNYIIGCRQSREEAFHFISADFAAKLVCLLCFLVFPTTKARPLIEGSSVWDHLMRLLYRVDAADNLFPSIHCLTSWFSFIAVRGNKKIPGWYRAASLLMAAAICISTLTTKQHVLPDVIAGVALAEGSYRFAGRSGFAEYYRNFVRKLSR